MPAPVERRLAAVRGQLAGEALVDRLRELTRLAHVGGRGLEPEDVRVRRVRQRAGDRGGEAVADAEEALRGALAGDELGVVRVDVARQQRRAERVRTRDE